MHVLVTGAYGLIGSAVLARLHRDGHRLTGAGRSLGEARRRFPYAQWVEADFTRLDTPDAWRPLLAGIDAVVNCVGVLQDGAGDNVTRVQLDGTVALFDACAAAGIRRVVHVSAIGAAADAPTPFIRTKAQADAHLAIARPRLDDPAACTCARARRLWRNRHAARARGISRGDAHRGRRQPDAGGERRGYRGDHLALFARGAPARATWDLAHPQVHKLGDIVAALRQWHGFPPRPQLRIPTLAQPAFAMFAEIVGLLGWRSPARWTALAQLKQGAVGDPAAWITATGIKPRSLDTILAERPASVQDRWFARLYLLKPLAILSLALFWILTGVIALGPGRATAVAQMTSAGFSPSSAELTVVLGSLIDIALGLLVCLRKFARIALLLMLAVTLGYLVAGTILTPQLWTDPLGPLLKIVPILIATLLTLAIVDDR